jgi:hypothetical protein
MHAYNISRTYVDFSYALSSITVIKSRDVASTRKKRNAYTVLFVEGEEKKIFERRRHSGGDNFKSVVKRMSCRV